MLKAFHERHDYLIKRLSAMPGIQVLPADGTFYLFPNVQAVVTRLGLADDVAFAEALLDKAGIALVPGTAFGAPGCIRLSFATDLDTLKEAMDRLESFIQA